MGEKKPEETCEFRRADGDGRRKSVKKLTKSGDIPL
jgi:hypothetical protein